MKGQTKVTSLIEQILNVSSGFLIAMLVWKFLIISMLGIEHNLQRNILITAIFTVVSVVRGFLWRRLFNFLMVRNEKAESEGK